MKQRHRMLAGMMALLMMTITMETDAVFCTTEEPVPNLVPVMGGEASDYGYLPVTGLTTRNEQPLLHAETETFPAIYDLREEGYVSGVRNQARTNTCWAHSALAAAESNMLMTGMAEEGIDLSESHMTWFAFGKASEDPDDPMYGDGGSLGTDAYLQGGNAMFACSMLARWSGVQLESNAAPVAEMAEIPEEQRYVSYGHLKNSDWLDASDMDGIKSHIMQTGALSAAMYYSSSHYSSAEAAYYQEETDVPNHAVAIVGWDDTFSRENFLTAPAGDGAWICKNSGGAYWGDSGYFYVSYYDIALSNISSFEITDTKDYGSIYQYDGIMYSTCNFDDYAITGANVFTAEKDEILSAVSFYTAEAGVPYMVYLYENVSADRPMSGTRVAAFSGTMEYAGYHVLPLEEAVSVAEGTRFSVVLVMNQQGASICSDNYNETEGRSFYTYGIGRPMSNWTDASNGLGVNFCIKVLTAYDAGEEPTEEPTNEPTELPTDEPTEPPTDEPTELLTDEPTELPTDEPTESPTDEPTETSTDEPTETPTDEPTEFPTDEPTESPTDKPTESPTDEPTESPTDEPTESPTDEPTESDIKGDINLDNKVSLVDVVMMQKYLLGLVQPESPGLQRADMNSDGIVNGYDLAFLKRLVIRKQ